VFLFVDLFDNVGTLVAVGRKAGLIGPDNQIPRLNRILFSDAIATVIGATAGTSTVVRYIESSAGVAAGGRTGVTAAVTGLLFLQRSSWPAGRCDSTRRYRTRSHRRRQSDDVDRRRHQMVRSRNRSSGVSHHDGDPHDLQHRQRPRLRFLFLDRSEAASGTLRRSELDGLRA